MCIQKNRKEKKCRRVKRFSILWIFMNICPHIRTFCCCCLWIGVIRCSQSKPECHTKKCTLNQNESQPQKTEKSTTTPEKQKKCVEDLWYLYKTWQKYSSYNITVYSVRYFHFWFTHSLIHMCNERVAEREVRETYLHSDLRIQTFKQVCQSANKWLYKIC